MVFFLAILASSWCLVHLGCASFASHFTCMYKAWVSKMCLLLYTPCGRSIGGGIIFVTSWEVCWAAQNNCQSEVWYGFVVFCHCFKLYMLAFSGTAQSP